MLKIETRRKELMTVLRPMVFTHGGEIALPDVTYEAGYLRTMETTSVIGAAHDIEAARLWIEELETRKYSAHTVSAAIREVDRFVMWAAFKARKPLSDLRREDILAYRRFLENPDKNWVGMRRPKKDERWRPFRGPLSSSSVSQAMNILHGLYDYLVAGQYLKANPFTRMGRGPQASSEKHDEKRLVDPTMWTTVMRHLNSWPQETARQQFTYERARFILVFSYLLAPRVSDFPNHRMGDLTFKTHGTTGPGGWWWRACGKGDKRVDLPVNDDAMTALKRWRRSLGLSDVPTPYDEIPLVPRKNDYSRTIGSSMIYRVVKEVMKGAADSVENEDHAQSERLCAASPHWLRHTALSRMADVLPTQVIQRLGRHSDIKTTGGYVHVGDSALHEAAQKHRMRWLDETA